MNVLIQEHPEINLLPLMNCLAKVLPELNVAVFNHEVNAQKLLADKKPNIIFFHGDKVSEPVHELLVNGRCALIEHENPKMRNSLDLDQRKFSIVDREHENYFSPPCNHFLLGDAEEKEKFRTDISFIGPAQQRAVSALHPFLDADSDFAFRIYGENRYKNWRYCGVARESDVQHIYRSSKLVPVFNNELEYDFRVLDCIFAGGVPLIEENAGLEKRLGKTVRELMFTDRKDIVDKAREVIENRDEIVEKLKRVRKTIISDLTWHNMGSRLFKMIGLKKTATKLEEDQRKLK